MALLACSGPQIAMPNAPDEEPLFRTFAAKDLDYADAHARAAATIGRFREWVLRSGPHRCYAKLSFRDPADSGDARSPVLYLWLHQVQFHPEERLFSATFFEVPKALREWHRVGQRLAFEAEDVFDWYVDESGLMHGGFTLRVVRDRLSGAAQADFDASVGARAWAPLEPRAGAATWREASAVCLPTVLRTAHLHG